MEDLLAKYAEWMRSWGASDSTVKERVTAARGRLRAWGPPDEFTKERIESWLASRDLRSDWSRATYYGHLMSFCEWLVATGRLPANPVLEVRKPKRPKSVPRPLSEAEVQRVLGAATGDVRAWVLLAMLAGLRAHEVAKFRGEDISVDTIHVVGKGRKSAILPTHPDLWALAQQYPRQGYWFPERGGSIEPVKVSLQVGRLFRSVDIPQGSLHRLRHTHATRLLRSGVNIRVVQRLMRHESVQTTAAYTAVDEDEMRAAINRLSA